MLVFAAVVPHPPLLIPQIGKENKDRLKKTEQGFDILEDDLNEANPDTLIIISPHGDVSVENFSINTNETYKAQFQDFGDFSTELEFKSDLQFINKLKSENETNLPLQLIYQDNLDHGASVPLYYLTRKNKDRRIVPINYSYLNYEEHVKFGEAIKEAIFSLDKRYAIIASGDLSHRLSKQAPEGFSPKAKEFDKKIVQLLKKRNLEAIMSIDSALIEEAAECGLRSILVLLGAIQKMNYDFQVLSYEAPFGVGHLVGEFKLR
jgi:MEMO1 family protein